MDVAGEAKWLLVSRVCADCKGMYVSVPGCKHPDDPTNIKEIRNRCCDKWQKATAGDIMAREG